MPTVLLVRHGRTTANATGVLAGRTPGVGLDDVGRDQAARTAERLAAVPLAAVVTSPLQRCEETARAILDRQLGSPGEPPLEMLVEPGITECDYGAWQGRPLKDLAGEPLWSTVQAQPSAVTFPDGESMAAMQARSVMAVRAHDATVREQHGHAAVWVAVAHGDIIKAVLADALGMHLDLFQRIAVGPASVSIVRYGPHRPEVVATSTDGGDLSWLAAPAAPGPTSDDVPAGDAPVGGGAGHA
ncbi:histidine phosphatase family protein [Luteimicrobium subarcticum]|uniref:Putative phosphomutase (TIGR03848 family) n=1 Tax=Luteimicrobium subarcticum TaxID=620910 RepID=A0A2M8WW30_9MICO|nr:histidine phosphatase family protein [Luteimicrobium subarcticum]PJI95123.1 putative phosphomutase (TIGR03848 family) [Luteimicrobium subarcticum]